MRKQWVCYMLLFCLTMLFCSLAQAEEITTSPEPFQVKTIATQIGENCVSYPQLTGLENEAIQEKINTDLILAADIGSHIVTLTTLQDSSWGLNVDFTFYQKGDLFSVVIQAEGKMPTGRQGHSNTALCYDLSTGERVTLADLFTNPNRAVMRMESIAQASIEKTLSEYVENANVLPLPTTSFGIDAYGITFYYPSTQFSWLDGTSGACQFFFSELQEEWLTTEESFPAKLSLVTETSSIQKESLKAWVENGQIDAFPISLSTLVSDVTSQYPLLRTPDQFPMGAYLTFSNALFREVRLITDTLNDGKSIVEGIQWQRGAFGGLVIGQTTSDAWQSALGAPARTLILDESLSYDYDLPVGQTDIYVFGMNELRLHANQNGQLVAIQINLSKN